MKTVGPSLFLLAMLALTSASWAQDEGASEADDRTPAELMRDALAARASGDHWGAAALIDRAVEAEPTAERVAELGATYWMIADQLYQSGEGTRPGGGQAIQNSLLDAQRTLERSLEMGETVVGRVYLGLTLRYRGAAEKGYAELERAVELGPKSPLALRVFGLENLNGGGYAIAEKLFVRLIEVTPDDAEAHFLLGRARYFQGDVASAEEALVAALLRDPRHAQAYAYLRGAYLNRGLYVQMLNAIDAVLKKHPDARFARLERAATLRARGDFEDAKRELEHVLGEHRDAYGARLALAEILAVNLPDPKDALRTRTAEALPHLRLLIEGEAVPEATVLGATALINWIVADAIIKLDWEKALVALDVWKMADPENGLVWANRGTVLRRLGRYAEAARSYEAARSTRPLDPQVPNDLALVRLAQGKREQAIALLEQAVEIDPDHLDSLENLGIQARVDGDLAAARAWFRRAFDVAVARELPAREKYRRYLDLVSPLGAR